MMKLRKYVSLLLLVVYMASTGWTAYASLSCRCVTWTRSHAVHTTACTHGCAHHTCTHRRAAVRSCGCATLCNTAIQQIHGAVQAPCCEDRHSTEIALYTPGDDERSTRNIAPASEIPAKYDNVSAPFAAASTDKTVERRAPFISDGYLHCAGLRAPPVLA